MATPDEIAIAALEEEISALTTAVDVLRRRQSPNGARPSFTPDFTSVKATRDEPTNEGAVKAILKAAYPQHLGTMKIVDLGPTIGGRDLNTNSVRWVLKHGVDRGDFDKKKENGRVSYKLNP